MKQSTVNVLEMFNGNIMQLVAFDGWEEAEKLFTKMIEENGAWLEAGDLDFYLDEGMFDDDNGWMIYIIHSS